MSVYTFADGQSVDTSEVRVVGPLRQGIGDLKLSTLIIAGVGQYELRLFGDGAEADFEAFKADWLNLKGG